MKSVTRRHWLAAALLGLLSSLVAFVPACEAKKTESKPAREYKLVVFAAASLHSVFRDLAPGFERQHPGVRITFNFAGTQEIRTQLEHGAQADVFAAADTKHMAELEQERRVKSPIVFALNEPVIVVSPESARAVRGIYDLPSLDRIVIGAESVPIGRYTLKILDSASASLGADFRSRVEAKVVSRELNVRQVLAKVRLGEAQAGFVYKSDVIAADSGLSVVTIPPEMNVWAEYPIAVVAEAPQPKLAEDWVAWVRSPDGLDALRRGGFAPPTDGGKPP